MVSRNNLVPGAPLAALTLTLGLTSCGGGQPEILTVGLPDGTVGELYAIQLLADGGKAPATWSLADGSLPDGLVLNPTGAISGVPTVPGEASLGLVLTDAKGRQDTVQLDLSVAYDADALLCGGTVNGELQGGGIVSYDPVFDAPGGVTWVQLPLPDPEVTRIDLTFDVLSGGYTQLYFGLPGTEPGDTDEDAYVWGGGTFSPTGTARIDLGTDPDLVSYRAADRPIVIALLSESPTPLAVSAACSDGPVFTQLVQLPTLVGQPIATNYNVEGDENATTLIWTDDALPDGVTMDERGRMSGTLDAPGVWPFTIHARDADGRERSEQTWLTTYEHLPVGCGESASFRPFDTYYAGDLYYFYDPRSYGVFEVTLPEDVSRVTATVSGADSVEIGTSAPGIPQTFFADRSVDGDTEASIDVDPGTWPPIGDYAAVQDALYFQAWHFDYSADEPELTVDITCSTAPLLGQTALPVIRPSVRTEHELPEYGGEGAITWSAEGLPAGLTLSEDGRLEGRTSAAGLSTVELTLQDEAGQSSTETLPLHVGWPSACENLPRLACGETESGVFEVGMSDDYTTLSQIETSWCIAEAGANDRIDLTITGEDDARMEVNATLPGQGSVGRLTARTLSGRSRPEVAVLDANSEIPLSAWADQPLFVRVRAWEAGAWSLDVHCE